MSEPLASYTFMPWLRQGIVSKIEQPDTLGAGAGPGERASVTISLQVRGDPVFVSDDVQLVGPGDVVGISPRAVVRTEPRHWVTDFEPNYLAFIEFYDEDFPWRYTPARAVEKDDAGAPVSNSQQTKLRPWLFLMVLAEDEFEPVQTLSDPLPAVRLTGSASPAAIFPPANQAWAWAHVHVSRDVTDNNTHTTPQTVDALENLLQENPDHALSRLVGPRKLRPETAYHAFVIPAFEVGRLAGLGQETTGQDALAPSWDNGQVEYPVYYRWHFRTGVRGDFEYLVNLLEPRPVDPRVGIRDMDMQDPDFGVDWGMGDGPNEEPVMGLEGALKSPDAVPRPVAWPPADPADYPPFLQELQALINLQDVLLNPAEGEEGHPDPVIGPPLYGRWHALQRRLHADQSGWVNELNRDPRYRVPAGSGTLVVQTNQEDYMRRAWEQLGEVLAANQKIRQAQLSLAAIHHIHARYLLPLSVDQQVAVAQAVHARVVGSDTTLFRQVKQSRLPQAALSPTFRRITRPRGPVIRRAAPESYGQPSDLLVRLNEGKITAAPPKVPPEGQINLDEVADDLIPVWLPDWLRRPLIRRLARFVLLILLWLVSLLSLDRIGRLLSNLLDALDAVLASERLKEGNLTTEAVDRVPPLPNFVVTEPGDELPPDIDRPGDQDSPEAANLRTALHDLHDRLQAPLPEPPERPPLDLFDAGLKLVQALDPVYAVPKRVRGIVAIPTTFEYLRPMETIVPVMAHPAFADPMYKPLRDISSELLIPNLDLIANNTITLLETNPKFIEAYMVGLNHEMARELLWREYVTDQRGSPFRQFWDVADMVDRSGTDPEALEETQRDITPLDTWGRSTPLGNHENRPLPTGGEEEESRLVLVIRGDLLKKYPTSVIYARKARWVDDPDRPRKIRVLDERDPAQNLLEPIFKAAIEPDLRFLGFDLTASVAKGDPTPPPDGEEGTPGYFFVIQERPGEPRFGLDIGDATPPPPTSWNELAWNHLGDPETIGLIDLTDFSADDADISESPDSDIVWGSNAADMAYILYQVPVMVAVHADDMLR